MMSELARAIEQIAKDKGIPREVLVEACEKSILAAARKMLGPNTDIEAQYNEELGEVELFEFRTVVEELEDEEVEISLEEARELDPGAEVGDSLGIKADLDGFGRIAAQTAKQVLLQHVRDAEREYIYNEYKDRKDELITGVVRRFEKGSYIVDLGKAEAILPYREQIPTESYRPGDRVQAYVADVLRTSRGPQIILSRSHPNLIRRLFEMEVPEIFEGIVRIEAVAREPGYRAKIAVVSRDSDVDPVGACVGMKGSRVQAVVQELRGEKIDIIPWSIDPAKFVCNAIAPASVTKVIIDEESRSMELIVPDDQLSLAIGKRGQNVRLAAQLTGWRIDIIGETKIQELNEAAREELKAIEGFSETLIEILVRHGYRRMTDVADTDPEELVDLLGLEIERATQIVSRARELVAERGTAPDGSLKPLEEGEAADGRPADEPADESIGAAGVEGAGEESGEEAGEGQAETDSDGDAGEGAETDSDGDTADAPAEQAEHVVPEQVEEAERAAAPVEDT